MSQLSLLQELRERGLVEQIANESALAAALEAGPIAGYCGFDPTALSLHVGNLVPVMILAHLQRRGHRPIAIVGGATGMIGDPSGKDAERQLLGNDAIDANCAAIRTQLGRFVHFDEGGALMLNNHDWIGRFSYIDWLREVGKYFTVNYMIAKESVKRRLEAREQGISYTEFSYMMLQAYDFLHLYEQHHCILQIGGSDQWGNITAGIDLVHKKCGASVFGLTTPLITTASGEKFGKSAGNAVWLDAAMTSPYRFYQYWLGADDRDVSRWLRLFTFIDLAEIDQIVAEHAAAPHKRNGQRRVAEEVTRLVHGESGLRRAQRATEILFGGTIENIDDAEVAEIFGDVPSSTLAASALSEGVSILDLVASTGTLATSKGEARRLLQQGGLSLNNVRVTDEKLVVNASHLASASALVLRAGKAKYHVVRVS